MGEGICWARMLQILLRTTDQIRSQTRMQTHVATKAHNVHLSHNINAIKLTYSHMWFLDI